jgi:phosphopantothenoylcysteine decarboxylase / phosphopantothenate---cysteine ligase
MKILVTAGPTQEPIDPVRFISNRSSGKMGYAIAAAAVAHGHEVRLVSGPVAMAAPPGAILERVTTAEEMRRAVDANLGWCNALVMAAAVSDWRPVRVSETKLKKDAMPAALPLERTADILKEASASKGNRIHIGFAAETGAVGQEALRKLKAKNLDLIVANDVSRPDSGFGADTNKVTFFAADGTVEELPLLSKEDVAGRIVAWLERRSGSR